MAETATGLLLSDDLLFASRIAGTARALGLTLRAARTPAELEARAEAECPRCVVLDLANPGLILNATIPVLKEACPQVYLVAYGSHVDAATLKAARVAGCDVVLPRSRFVEDLPRQLPVWFAGREAPPS
jgi:hypothetical protein